MEPQQKPVSARPVYTRRGDGGMTDLYGGQRLQKSDIVFEAIGDIDELSCFLGKCRLHMLDYDEGSPFETMARRLLTIQRRLFDVNSSIATPRRTTKSKNKLQRTTFDTGSAEELEAWQDEMSKELPPLRNFIVPSGGKRSTNLHLARAVCRRAERHLCKVDDVEPQVRAYINRLSDFLFVCARYAAKLDGFMEHTYQKARSRCSPRLAGHDVQI